MKHQLKNIHYDSRVNTVIVSGPTAHILHRQTDAGHVVHPGVQANVSERQSVLGLGQVCLPALQDSRVETRPSLVV